MGKFIEKLARSALDRFGLEVLRRPEGGSTGFGYPPDFSNDSIRICNAVRNFSMTSPERVNALVEAVQYVVNSRVEGSLVECGVWKGGSSMAMIFALQSLDCVDREIWLYDTFEGMPAPSELDLSVNGENASDIFSGLRLSDDSSDWCRAPLSEVTTNVLQTGYPSDLLYFVKGKVEDTIPKHLPQKISLLRLDTDWYESTHHELMHLFPRLQPGGVLLIDDYGHWKGARRAVDQYLQDNAVKMLLNRVDYTARLGIKL